MRSSEGAAASAAATNRSRTGKMRAIRRVIICGPPLHRGCHGRLLRGGGELRDPDVRGRCRERPALGTGLGNPASALEDLLLAHGDGLAPPTLVPGERDVVARDLRRLAVTGPQREEAVVTRRV